MTTECYDEHGCLIVGDPGPHVPFAGKVWGLKVGAEAEELLRDFKTLVDIPVSVSVTYDADDPNNRETYVWVGET